MSVRVLQRNRTNRIYIERGRERELDIEWGGEMDYKALPNMIMEAEKTQDLQLACYRPRRADV